ncbi:MAG: 4-(cytidine 5'-diphospho)-2-C-methyl-D-erythritol kinase, partial [Pseudomonadota bacterium]
RKMAKRPMTAAEAKANRFQRTAHAKINLCLHVTGRRSDGYHMLDSLVGFAAFGDQISIEPAETDIFEIRGTFGASLGEQLPEQNLVIRARDWLRARHEREGSGTTPARISLNKKLPVAAGIGGGSADAAATLAVLARFWQTPAQWLEDREIIAAELGADVPMCLHQSPLRVTGIGETLALWHNVPMLPCVLVNPNVPISTPEVFATLSNRNNSPLDGMPPSFTNRLALADWLAKQTRNDLQEAAESLCPTIIDCIKALERTNALLARMSGSGASCFGLYDSIEGAQLAASAIAQAEPEWFVKATAILPSPPQRDEDYETWVESMNLVRSLH